MTKKLLAVLLSLCLWTASLSGCGGPAAETDQALTDTFEELLAADYEVHYLFFSDGMKVDAGLRQELDGQGYSAVTAPYSTMSQLKERLEDTYAQEETRSAILKTQDPNGHPLVVEKDGKLWRSDTPNLLAVVYEVREGSIRMERRDEGAITFLFEETRLDGSLYETKLTMERTSAGWRLAGPRWEAERKLLREGSDIDSVIPEDAARQAASAFLAALVEGDIDEINRITEAWGTWPGAWDKIRITKADITEAVEERDSRGDYRVMVTVEAGGGVFPEGEQEFRLVVTSDDYQYHTEEVIPVYFRPTSERYHNWRDYSLPETEVDRVASRVEIFISMAGWQTFATPWELPAETLAEFSLLFAEAADGGQLFTPEEFNDAVERTFGITGFDGRGTSFYSKEQDRYLLWGRGPNQPHLLIHPVRIIGTRAEVDVTFYGDILCTLPTASLRYSLYKGDDGGWRLFSAQQM